MFENCLRIVKNIWNVCDSKERVNLDMKIYQRRVEARIAETEDEVIMMSTEIKTQTPI